MPKIPKGLLKRTEEISLKESVEKGNNKDTHHMGERGQIKRCGIN
jgi:hypothetical protein